MPVICFSIFTGPVLGLCLIVMEEEVTTPFPSLIQGLEYTKVGTSEPSAPTLPAITSKNRALLFAAAALPDSPPRHLCLFYLFGSMKLIFLSTDGSRVPNPALMFPAYQREREREEKEEEESG